MRSFFLAAAVQRYDRAILYGKRGASPGSETKNLTLVAARSSALRSAFDGTLQRLLPLEPEVARLPAEVVRLPPVVRMPRAREALSARPPRRGNLSGMEGVGGVGTYLC